jgi:hypothetical protein
MAINWTRYRREVVEFSAGEFDFKVMRIQDWHLRLTNHKGKQLDYFPKSGKATWVGTNQWIYIADIETFIQKTFLNEKAYDKQPAGNGS